MLLGMLDLTAAFDCVDHNILLLRIERVFRLGPSIWLRARLAAVVSDRPDSVRRLSRGSMLKQEGQHR